MSRARTALVTLAGVLTLVLASVNAVSAGAYMGRQDALAAAFPDAAEVETRRFFLTDEQRQRVRDLSGSALEDGLVTVYLGRGRAPEPATAGEVRGYAYFETHNVRTVPETLLVVVDLDGRVGSVLMLAFYEPPEYEPPRRWLEQFKGRRLDPTLRVRRGIHGIAGSSLSADAVTRGVRRTLALHQVLFGDPAPVADKKGD